MFEAIRQRNPLLLHGQTLRAIVANALFEELDFSNACNLKDADLLSIGPSLIKVRKLKVVGCHYISEAAMAFALQHCSSLTSLALEMNSKIRGDMCLGPDGSAGQHACETAGPGESVVEHGRGEEKSPPERKLREVFACSPRGETPAAACARLEGRYRSSAPHLPSCKDPTEQDPTEGGNAGMVAGDEADVADLVLQSLELQRGLSMLSFRTLTSLSLAESKALCDEGLRHVVRYGSNLVDLNLNKCEKLGADVLCEIGTTSLTKLSIGFLPNLSDRAIQRIARACWLLRSLDLSGSYNVGDKGLKSVAARLSGLHTLSLSFLEKVTSAGVEMIAVGLPALESLDLEQTSVTDASLEALIQFSPRLQALNVAFCHNLSEAKIVTCLQQCRLKTLNVTHCRGVSLQTRFWLMAKAGNHRGEVLGDGAGGVEGAGEEASQHGPGWKGVGAVQEQNA